MSREWEKDHFQTGGGGNKYRFRTEIQTPVEISPEILRTICLNKIYLPLRKSVHRAVDKSRSLIMQQAIIPCLGINRKALSRLLPPINGCIPYLYRGLLYTLPIQGCVFYMYRGLNPTCTRVYTLPIQGCVSYLYRGVYPTYTGVYTLPIKG